MAGQTLSEELIQKLLVQSMRERNREAVSVLKMIKTRISTTKGRLKDIKELAAPDIEKLIAKELKEIRDTVESLHKAGMPERVAEEEKKIQALEGLLPQQLTDKEIQDTVDEVVAELGTDNFGTVMKAVMARVAGRADGKQVSEQVRKALA